MTKSIQLPVTKARITVFTYYRDGGDGGGTFRVFPTPEDLLEYRNQCDDEQFDDFDKLCDWCNDDPYERGEVETKCLDCLIKIEDGEISISPDGWHFHWGQ